MSFFVPKQLKTNTVTANIVTIVYNTNFILYKKLTLLASFILFFRSPIIKIKLCIFFTHEYILYPNERKLNINENLLLSIIANNIVNTFKNNSQEKYCLYNYYYLLTLFTFSEAFIKYSSFF